MGAVLLAVLWASAWAGSPARAVTESQRRSSLVLTGMTFVESRGGRNDLVLEADHVRVPSGSDVAQLRGVRVHMDETDRADAAQATPGSFEMTCDRGELTLPSSDFRAEGHVRGHTGDGRRFYTSWVRYRSHGDVLETDAPVRIEDGVRTLQGQGFQYHVREGRLVLTGGAKVIQE